MCGDKMARKDFGKHNCYLIKLVEVLKQQLENV